MSEIHHEQEVHKTPEERPFKKDHSPWRRVTNRVNHAIKKVGTRLNNKAGATQVQQNSSDVPVHDDHTPSPEPSAVNDPGKVASKKSMRLKSVTNRVNQAIKNMETRLHHRRGASKVSVHDHTDPDKVTPRKRKRRFPLKRVTKRVTRAIRKIRKQLHHRKGKSVRNPLRYLRHRRGKAGISAKGRAGRKHSKTHAQKAFKPRLDDEKPLPGQISEGDQEIKQESLHLESTQDHQDAKPVSSTTEEAKGDIKSHEQAVAGPVDGKTEPMELSTVITQETQGSTEPMELSTAVPQESQGSTEPMELSTAVPQETDKGDSEAKHESPHLTS